MAAVAGMVPPIPARIRPHLWRADRKWPFSRVLISLDGGFEAGKNDGTHHRKMHTSITQIAALELMQPMIPMI